MENPLAIDSLAFKTVTVAPNFSAKSRPKSKALPEFSDPSTAIKTLRIKQIDSKEKYASQHH